MELTGQELTNIASEVVSTVEGAYGFGIEYEDIVDIICELLIEKLELKVVQEEIFSLQVLDKSEE